MHINITHYPDRQTQAAALATQVASELEQALATRQTAHMAVAGGTTPAPFMQQLAGKSLDWPHITVTLTDERQVPPTHPRSNAKLLQENLLSTVPQATFIPLYDEAPNNTPAAVTQQLAQYALPLDVCVLGMGEDGHFASLFPGLPELAEGLNPDSPQTVLFLDSPALPEPRISLTLAALLGSQYLHLLITEQTKLHVLEKIMQSADFATEMLPVGHLLKYAQGRITVHYAD